MQEIPKLLTGLFFAPAGVGCVKVKYLKTFKIENKTISYSFFLNILVKINIGAGSEVESHKVPGRSWERHTTLTDPVLRRNNHCLQLCEGFNHCIKRVR